MILGKIQHRGRRSRQAVRRLQLEARQLQHIELGGRVKQVQRGRAQIAADPRAQTRGFSHGAQQLGRRRFAVAAGDGHHRRLRRLSEEFDVPDQGQTIGAQRAHEGFLQRHARRHHRRRVAGYRPGCGETTKGETCLRVESLQLRQVGRLGAAVGSVEGDVAGGTETQHRGPGSTEADDQHASAVRARNHRIFNVDRPMRTRIKVMIQKRTMMRGSGQPLSS